MRQTRLAHDHTQTPHLIAKECLRTPGPQSYSIPLYMHGHDPKMTMRGGAERDDEMKADLLDLKSLLAVLRLCFLRNDSRSGGVDVHVSHLVRRFGCLWRVRKGQSQRRHRCGEDRHSMSYREITSSIPLRNTIP